MARTITRILVPTDFSPPSDAALVFARELADKYGARLSLLHVVTNPEAIGHWTPEVYVPARPDVRERLVREAMKRAENALSPEERSRHDVIVQVLHRSVAEDILDFARENDVSLIVMGTHGRRGLTHLLLGSVAEHVVRQAPCPVVTTRAQAEPKPSAEDSIAEERLAPAHARSDADEVC